MKEKKEEKNKKQENSECPIILGWFQIIMLIGKPLWDGKLNKWRILNGYQSVLGNNNRLFYEVTFTDTPYLENFIEKQLYINIPKTEEDKSSYGNKNSDKKAHELKQKMKNKQYIQVRKDATDSYGYIEAIDTLIREIKMYQR